MHRDRESSSRFTERYIYDPKVRNLNNDWIGDSIKESLLTLLGVKIHLWLCFIKKKKKKEFSFSQHNTPMYVQRKRGKERSCQSWSCWSRQENMQANHAILSALVMLKTSPKRWRRLFRREAMHKNYILKSKPVKCKSQQFHIIQQTGSAQCLWNPWKLSSLYLLQWNLLFCNSEGNIKTLCLSITYAQSTCYFFMVSYISHIHTQEEKSQQVEISNCSHACHHLHICYNNRHCSILLSDVPKINAQFLNMLNSKKEAGLKFFSMPSLAWARTIYSTPRSTLPLQPHLSVHLVWQSPTRRAGFNAQDGQPHWVLCSGGCLEEPHS